MSSEYFRLFIAIQLPEEVKTKIETAQAELRDVLSERAMRWTRREQFHLTLKFLGDIDAQQVEPLIERVRGVCQVVPSLSLQVARVGCFPDLRHPRVLWVGVQDQAGELIPLQKAIGNAVRDFTIEQPEKQFSGHVTLGRTKILSRSESELWCNLVSGMAQRNFGQWTAGGLEIIRSELLPAGPRHTCLATVAFTG